MNRSSESFGNSDDSNVIQRESGLYVYNNNKHTTPPSEQSPQIEPQVSSQNEINLDDYEEVLVPSKEEAIKRFQETGEISPTIISVVKKDRGTIENTDPVPTQPETPSTPETPPTPEIPLTPNIPPKPESPAMASVPATQKERIMTPQQVATQTEAPQETIIESKSNEDEMKRLNDSLRKAREENPLEAVQNTLRRQESQRQQAFAREIEKERISNDPTYKKKVLSETEINEDPRMIALEEKVKQLEERLKEKEEAEKKEDPKVIELEEKVKQLEEMLKVKKDGEWIEYPTPTEGETKSPEQRLKEITDRIKELEEKGNHGPLTRPEFLEYRTLQQERESLLNSTQQTETQDTEEEDRQEEEKRREKKLKRWAIVAGVVGAGTAILGGTGVGVWAAVGGAIVAGAAGITGFIGRRRIERLQEKMTKAQGEDRAKIEKKITTWNKVLKVTDGTIKIARGFALGAAAGNLVSHFFMGGKGLVGMYQASKMTPAPEGFSPDQSPTGQDPSGHANPGSRGLENPVNNTVRGSVEIGTPEINTVETPTFNTEGVLVRNGRVDLPGSAWNGNMAGAPITGGELSPSSFAGGATNMGAFNLEKALSSSGLTRGVVTQNLTTPQIHSLLNTYQANPSTSLTSALGNIGTEGAQNLIQMISGN